MSIEITDLLLLLAAAQGLFLTVLIFHKHGGLFANRFLGILILLYSLLLLHLLFGELGYAKNFPHFTLMAVGVGFLVPPLHYLYAKFLVQRAEPFNKANWLHFLPFIIYEAYRLLQFFLLPETTPAILNKARNEGLPLDSIIFNWALLLLGFAYMYLTILILNRFAGYIKNVFSTIDKVKLDWLRNITYLATGVYAVFGIENILLLLGINLSNYFNLSSALIALYVYALGYLGLFKSEVFAAPAIVDSISHLSALGYHRQPARAEKLAVSQKYEKSGLSAEMAKQYLHQLRDLMEKKKPYTDSELTLNQLADMLSISPHNLSEVINTQLEQNFFDFVNHYRLEKVKKDLADPEKKDLKLLAIAFDAGFNSKSSFNAIFKKHTNLTPSEYRRQVVGDRSPA